ncbi:MAG: phosphoribosylformylglycinamidine synthase I [Bacteroidales bacterium]|jgi:phosphoribosylformylglycinamidine synthase|nr:phosphoribosylformylglycinamidine synthase I [Bacteroidales bacterium]
MKFGVVNFPGSTGFSDTLYALNHILEQDVVQLWYEDTSLPDIDVVVLPTGASFGDAPEPGMKAAKSPIMEPVKRFAENRGFVLGIGNGFQILCQAGMLSGKLITNESQTFVGKNVFTRPDNTATPLTRLLSKGQLLQLPIAHAFGRYQADAENMREFHQNGQILLRYCSEDGKTTSASNPDGSIDNVAAICNKHMNVFGIMACIERAVDPDLGNVNGLLLFQSLFRF